MGLRLFTRPLPLGLLALMALNDHLLKGAGVLPGWLTGKLSDFAGLFVAPLLASELWLCAFPKASPGRILWGSSLAVAFVFTAINTLAMAAGFYAAAIQALWQPLGLSAHHVKDPTDLVALASVGLSLGYGLREARRAQGDRLGPLGQR